MADIRLAKPAAGTTQTVPSAPNGRFIFDFPADAATLTRNGDDLVLTFEDGSSIQLQGFYTTYSKEDMPSFQVEGVEISGQDFFAALGEDLMPAAGPAASSASRSGRYNEYGGSDLLDGIDHLGRLDIGFDGGTQLATDTVEPSAPEVDIDYDVTIAAGPEAGAVDLTVYEGGLAGGSQAGQAATPTTASGSLNINAPDGVASIVIGDVVVFENGKLTGNVVTTDEGTLAVTGYDPVTGKLDFSYTLDRNTTEHDKSDPATDTQISYDLTVTVTDTDGDSDSTTITVNVVDDAPSISASDVTVTEGSIATGEISYSYGADVPAGSTVTVKGGTLVDGTSNQWRVEHGVVILNDDGTFTFKADANIAETVTSQEIVFQVTDADGDVAEDTVTVTLEQAQAPGAQEGVQVDEAALPVGSDPSSNAEYAVVTVEGYTIIEGGTGTHGSIAHVDGQWVYTLAGPVTGDIQNDGAQFTGSDTVTITVRDDNGNTFTVDIPVSIKDDVPSISASDVTVTEGSIATGEISYSYGADVPAGSTVTVKGGTLVDGTSNQWRVEHGVVILNDDGTFTFKADANIAETVTSQEIVFQVTDADGDVAEDTVTVTLEQAQAPGAQEGVQVDEAALPVGSDPSSNAEYAVVTVEGYTIIEGGTGTHGSIAHVDGQWVYTLAGPVTGDIQNDGAQFTGSDTVTITVRDDNGNTFTVDIPVSIKDDVPSISASDVTVTEGSIATGEISYSYGADVPAGSTVTVKGGTLVDGTSNQWRVEHGVVILNDDGTFTFKADANIAETVTSQEIVFQVTDADGDVAEDTVTVTLEQAQAPGAQEGVQVDEAALPVGSDPSSNAEYAVVTVEGYTIIEGGTGTHGSIAHVDGQWVYTLAGPVTGDIQNDGAQFTGSDTVTITVRDDNGNTFTVDIPVSIKDDVPSISASDVTVTEGSIATGEISYSYGADVPAGSTVTVKGGTLVDGTSNQWRVEHGVVILNDDGTFTFKADANIAETVTSQEIVFQVTDADGDVAEDTVTVTLEQAQAPGAQEGVQVDEAALPVGSDPSSNAEYAVVTVEGYTIIEGGTGTHGSIAHVDGQWVYTLAGPVTGDIQNDGAQFTGSDTVTITVRDDNGNTFTVDIPVSIKDDVPSISASDVTVTEGSIATGEISYSYGADVPAGSTVTVKGGTLVDGTSNQWRVEHGVVILNDDGTFTFKADANIAETVTSQEIVFQVTDADGDVAEDTVTVTLEQAQAPGAQEGVQVDEAALPVGSDPSSNAEYAVVTVEGYTIIEGGTGTHGSIAHVDGQWVYTLAGPVTGDIQNDGAQFTGSDTVTITVRDDNGNTFTVDIPVSIKDDVPSISASDVTVTEGSIATGEISYSYGADVPAGSTVTVKGGTLVDGTSNQWRVEHGVVILNDDGTFTFKADANIAETVTSQEIVFQVTDADGDVAEDTVTVTLEQAQAPGAQEGVQVDEAALPVGSDPSSNAEYAVVTVEGYTIIEGGTGTHGSIAHVDGQWVYTLAGPVTGDIQNDGAQFTGSDTVTITVRDDNGNTFTVDIPVSIKDDVPTLTVGKPVTDMKPGDSGDNLVKVDEEISFINYKQTGTNENGKPVYEQTTGELSTKYWNDQITISAAKVTYDGVDEWGNKRISTEDPAGMSLDYSFYNGGEKQYYKGTPPKEDIDKGIAIRDGNSWYREAPESDWGLTVNGGEGQGEIQASGNTSEAVVINLNGYAYGMTIDFGAFFAGKSSDEDPAAGTGYDNVSEKALITFYKDGKLVYSTVVYGTDSGEFTFNTGDVVLEGFDKVVVSAVDNSTDKYKNESSDFTIQGFDFITKRNDPIIINKGTVRAESGADGFADAYTDIHARFDLAGMVNEGTLSADGTSGIITVLVDGQQTDVTLTLREGASGDSILTGTAANGEQLFTATLDKDGNWTMEQYGQFRVDNETETGSNQFELVFKTEDADGDVASTTVNVPLEVVDQTPATDTSIDNSADTIVITGSDGVAGTVAAGDSGGVDVITNVQPGQDYNISIMLDLSGSMNDPSGSAGMSRLAMAKVALKNFINDTLAKHDGEINLQLITFNKTATEQDTWVLKSGTTEEIKNYNQAEIAKIVKTLDKIGRGDGGTNYEAAMEKATEWFSKNTAEGGVAGNGGENLAFFISDGQPTYYQGTDWWGKPIVDGEGTHSDQATVQATLEAAQDLQNAGGGVKVNAIGIGTNESLHEKAQTILDLIDNTGGSGQTVTEYPYQYNAGSPFWPQYDWITADCTEGQELVLGDSDLVNSDDDLTAALIGGGVITSTDLADAGDDEVDASASTSSVIVYGDVLNTDRLRYELIQNKGIEAALVAAGIDYGSGADVFQWLENAANANALTGTKFEGWTHDDSVKYMLQHAEELGYETRVDADGDFYLVKADGTVLNMDGAEADNVELDTLTGRGGGSDTIIGSQADDVIYGQEGNDLLVGDAPSESGEGSTVGSIEGTTVASIKAMDTDDLDAFIQSVEGPDADGDDRLFGGTGDDVLLGMGGDDYIDGGAGEDAIFGGSGNDIIVYDSNDYLVSGGSGIDFMVSDNSTLTLTELLSGEKNGNEGPIVSGIEVLLKGEDALSLTSLDQLAKDYGITLGTNAEGKETLTLDMSKWTEQEDGIYAFNGGAEEGGLTLETNLTPVDASDQSSEAVQQQVFILQNTNS